MGVDFIGPGPSTGYERPPHFPSDSGPPPVFTVNNHLLVSYALLYHRSRRVSLSRPYIHIKGIISKVTVSNPVPLTPSSPNTSQSHHVHLGSSIIPFSVLCVLGPTLSAYDVDLIGFVIKEMPNGGPVSRPRRLPNVPDPSRENSDPDHLQIPRAEDLKRLAGQYLNNSGSHVVKLRMKLNRSGGFKVLILLEVDDII
jgi:hypothetical protein